MIITDIVRDKKHCFKVNLDDGKTVFIDLDVVSEYSLKAGNEVSEEKLKEILRRSDYVRAKERALWYLDRMDRTEKQLSQKLREASFSEESIAAVMAFLRKYDLINDRRYAERFVRHSLENNLSRLEIRQKLFIKGIKRDIADEILSETEICEEESLSALIEKKYRSKLSAENGYEKVYAALVRKGFSYSAVRNALKKYSDFDTR